MNRSAIYEGLTNAAWAFVFLYVDVNLGTLNVLPEWAGCLLLWRAIALLEGERRDLALLRPFCLGLGLWHAVEWGLALFGLSLEGRFLPLDAVVAVVSLYFVFQLLTDLAALADTYQDPGLTLGKNLRFCRSVTAVLTVIYVLPLPWQDNLIAVTVLVLVQLGLSLAILYYLFRLRKCFLEPPPGQAPGTPPA